MTTMKKTRGDGQKAPQPPGPGSRAPSVASKKTTVVAASGLPPLRKKMSVQFTLSPGRTSRGPHAGARGGGQLLPDPAPSVAGTDVTEDGLKTVRFVYSEAVERGFRHRFLCPDFGPKSAKPAQPFIDVTHLQQLYAEFENVKSLLARKSVYLTKLAEEEEAAAEQQPPAAGAGGRGKAARVRGVIVTRRVSRKETHPLNPYSRLPAIAGGGQTEGMTSGQQSAVTVTAKEESGTTTKQPQLGDNDGQLETSDGQLVDKLDKLDTVTPRQVNVDVVDGAVTEDQGNVSHNGQSEGWQNKISSVSQQGATITGNSVINGANVKMENASKDMDFVGRKSKQVSPVELVDAAEVDKDELSIAENDDGVSLADTNVQSVHSKNEA